MPKPQATHQDTVGRFWDWFRDNLLNKGVKANLVRWYGRHAEQYLKAFAGRRLAEHTVRCERLSTLPGARRQTEGLV